MSKGKRILLADAEKISIVIGTLLHAIPVSYTTCGSIRRGTLPDVGDLDIVVSDLQAAWDKVHAHMGWHGVPFPKGKSSKDPRKFVVVKNLFVIPVSFYHAFPEEWGAMVLFLTGSFVFNIQMRAMAKKQGLKLNQYGLWEGENAIAGRDEEQIFMALGLPFIEPKDREFTPNDKLWDLKL